jgi:sRNA-binding regulator protein Hfq
LILNSQTNKTYCNSLSVNGTAITIYYNNGSANISLTSSILTLQTFNVIFLGVATTPSYIFCSVVPIY